MKSVARVSKPWKQELAGILPALQEAALTARQSGLIYHLTGPAALARDLAIKTMGANRMLARQDWIYDWRA